MEVVEVEGLVSARATSKKKLKNKKTWKRVKAKTCRNLGLQYVSDKTNKNVAAKVRGPSCECSSKSAKANMSWCKFHLLTEEELKLIFSSFYNLGNYNLQNAYLFGCMDVIACTRGYVTKRKVPGESRRKTSCQYFLKNSSGVKLRVCATAICNTLSISRKRLANVKPIHLDAVRDEEMAIEGLIPALGVNPDENGPNVEDMTDNQGEEELQAGLGLGLDEVQPEVGLDDGKVEVDLGLDQVQLAVGVDEVQPEVGLDDGEVEVGLRDGQPELGIGLGRDIPIVMKNVTPRLDRRGLHNNQPHKIKSAVKDRVREHIRKFPKYRSHYSRSENPDKVYIQSVKSMAEMYRLYCAECRNTGHVSVKYAMYSHIFNTDFNIGFKMPHSDTCKVCDTWLAKELETIPLAVRLHQLKAGAAYTFLKECKQEAQQADCEFCVITYDLQQSLPTPKIPTETVFYLRQLWVYNLGVHICNINNAVMCMWPESMASRGSSEITSCLMEVFKREDAVLGKRKLRCFSDSCAGQNKNSTVFLMYYLLVMTGEFDTIEHYFLVPGHIFLPSDSDFGVIEKKTRKTDFVYTPEDWCKLVETSRVKNPFMVQRMATDSFKDFQSINSTLKIDSKTTTGEKICMQKLTGVKIDKQNPGSILLKHSYSSYEAWKEVKVYVKKAGRQTKAQKTTVPSKKLMQDFLETVPLLHPNGRPIAPLKLQDLQTLLPFIPPMYHDVYKNLQASE